MDDRIELTIETRKAIEDELDKRTLAHRRRVHRIKSGAGLNAKRKGKAKSKLTTALDFLAIGDSWFEYPLNGNDIWFGGNTAIPTQLSLKGNPHPLILNYAMHGQATTAVLSYENQQRMISALSDSTQWINGSADGIMVSMGGDDMVGDQFAIYLDYNGSGLNVSRFNGALDSVRASYLDLFAFRDIFAPGKPIFGHCYDYALPDGVGAPCNVGPWLLPSLEFAGYDQNTGLTIVSQMIDMFHDMLQALANTAKYDFVLIDTRNTLQRVPYAPDGWANEIHPYPPGFVDLAQKFLLSLRAKFPHGSI